MPQAGQLQVFFHFCLWRCSGLCQRFRTHLFVFLWSRVSIELSSNTIFQVNQFSFFFLSAFFTIRLLHSYLVIGKMRVWMTLAFISNNTPLLLVIFPNSSTVALTVSAFSWFSGWSLHPPLPSPLSSPLLPSFPSFSFFYPTFADGK